jgi:hypothetical protein
MKIIELFEEERSRKTCSKHASACQPVCAYVRLVQNERKHSQRIGMSIVLLAQRLRHCMKGILLLITFSKMTQEAASSNNTKIVFPNEKGIIDLINRSSNIIDFSVLFFLSGLPVHCFVFVTLIYCGFFFSVGYTFIRESTFLRPMNIFVAMDE